MTAVVVVATIRPLPEYRAEVIAAMEKVIADVHANDDGCLLYALHEADALDVQILQPHPAGTAAQGAL